VIANTGRIVQSFREYTVVNVKVALVGGKFSVALIPPASLAKLLLNNCPFFSVRLISNWSANIVDRLQLQAGDDSNGRDRVSTLGEWDISHKSYCIMVFVRRSEELLCRGCRWTC
jgi:hypothetical protein